MPTAMSTPTVVYHWWSHPDEPPPYQNLRTPVVLSIATLRATCPDIPIVVFDVSADHQDWGYFPEKLNFHVVRARCKLEKVSHLVEGWQYLSRLIDINYYTRKCNYWNRLTFDKVLYLDSDVFLLKNPLPLAQDTDKFCWDGWNSGIFYYDFGQAAFMDFYDIFKHYAYAAIYSKDIREVLKKYVNYEAWYGVWDEMILTYMVHEHPELFNLIPLEEHVTARTLFATSPDAAKIFHCNGSLVRNEVSGALHARGLLCLICEEFYSIITKVLSEDDLIAIFGKDTLLHYWERIKFKLFKSIETLPTIKNEEGLYELHKLLGAKP